MHGLALHTLQNDLLHIRIMHRSGKEQGVHRCDVPRLKSLPHETHGSRAQWDEIWECIVKEKDLMVLVVVGTVESGLLRVNVCFFVFLKGQRTRDIPIVSPVN